MSSMNSNLSRAKSALSDAVLYHIGAYVHVLRAAGSDTSLQGMDFDEKSKIIRAYQALLADIEIELDCSSVEEFTRRALFSFGFRNELQHALELCADIETGVTASLKSCSSSQQLPSTAKTFVEQSVMTIILAFHHSLHAQVLMKSAKSTPELVEKAIDTWRLASGALFFVESGLQSLRGTHPSIQAFITTTSIHAHLSLLHANGAQMNKEVHRSVSCLERRQQLADLSSSMFSEATQAMSAFKGSFESTYHITRYTQELLFLLECYVVVTQTSYYWYKGLIHELQKDDVVATHFFLHILRLDLPERDTQHLSATTCKTTRSHVDVVFFECEDHMARFHQKSMLKNKKRKKRKGSIHAKVKNLPICEDGEFDDGQEHTHLLLPKETQQELLRVCAPTSGALSPLRYPDNEISTSPHADHVQSTTSLPSSKYGGMTSSMSAPELPTPRFSVLHVGTTNNQNTEPLDVNVAVSALMKSSPTARGCEQTKHLSTRNSFSSSEKSVVSVDPESPSQAFFATKRTKTRGEIIKERAHERASKLNLLHSKEDDSRWKYDMETFSPLIHHHVAEEKVKAQLQLRKSMLELHSDSNETTHHNSSQSFYAQARRTVLDRTMSNASTRKLGLNFVQEAKIRRNVPHAQLQGIQWVKTSVGEKNILFESVALKSGDYSRTQTLQDPHSSSLECKLPCALCDRRFSVENLPGRVIRNSILSLREEWGMDISSKKFQPPSYMYSSVSVCTFCFDLICGRSVRNDALQKSKPGSEDAIGKIIHEEILNTCANVDESGKEKEDGIVNLCRSQLARACQSSTLCFRFAKFAIDGDTHGQSVNACSHTHEEFQPWWQVDLGKNQDLLSIEVWNRQGEDIITNRLFPFWIMISMRPFSKKKLRDCITQCILHKKITVKRRKTTWNLPANTVGRYIRIHLDSFTFLHLAQVRVMGPKRKQIQRNHTMKSIRNLIQKEFPNESEKDPPNHTSPIRETSRKNTFVAVETPQLQRQLDRSVLIHDDETSAQEEKGHDVIPGKNVSFSQEPRTCVDSNNNKKKMSSKEKEELLDRLQVRRSGSSTAIKARPSTGDAKARRKVMFAASTKSTRALRADSIAMRLNRERNGTESRSLRDSSDPMPSFIRPASSGPTRSNKALLGSSRERS